MFMKSSTSYDPIQQRLHQRRRLGDRLFTAWNLLASLFVLAILVSVLWEVVHRGVQGLSLSLFRDDTPGPGSMGGLRNALVGSLCMVLGAATLATPLGVLAGIYIVEYGKQSRWVGLVRTANDLLLSTPSIIAGLIIYTLVVSPLHHFAAWAGSLSLSLLAIPVIVRATENMLSLVPQSLREAAIGLGAPYWKMIVWVSLRAAKTGMLTGVLLAIARISGETAPLLFTALNNQFFSLNMNQAMANLPVVIFQFAMSPYPEWQQLAWSGAFLVTFVVLGLSLTTRFILRLAERA
jgi:phosphate transport system permease protein